MPSSAWSSDVDRKSTRLNSSHQIISYAVFCLKKKKIIRYENLPLRATSGQRREVEFVSNIYDEGGESVVQCNIRDITERKALERRLEQAAEEASRLKSDFIAV